jgi:hypothetical protein
MALLSAALKRRGKVNQPLGEAVDDLTASLAVDLQTGPAFRISWTSCSGLCSPLPQFGRDGGYRGDLDRRSGCPRQESLER